MDKIIETLLNLLVNGGAEAFGALGWGLFLLERYYVTPRRENQFREDLSKFQKAYSELGKQITESFTGFHSILAVIKDRGER